MVLEEENRDIVGGEGEGIWARGERGEALQIQAAPTNFPPLQSRLFSRGWRRDSSSWETGRGKGIFFLLWPPFEILCLTSSHLGAGQGGLCWEFSTGPAATEGFQPGCGNQPC